MATRSFLVVTFFATLVGIGMAELVRPTLRSGSSIRVPGRSALLRECRHRLRRDGRPRHALNSRRRLPCCSGGAGQQADPGHQTAQADHDRKRSGGRQSRRGRPLLPPLPAGAGQLEIRATKPLGNQRDLALAYSPV